jgi:hypothetical protein
MKRNIVLIISAAVLLTSWSLFRAFGYYEWASAYKGLLRILLFIFAGVFSGNILEYTGIIVRLSFLGKFLIRLSGLPADCLQPVLLSFVSVAAANGALKNLIDRKKITEIQLIFTTIINNFVRTTIQLNRVIIGIIALLGWIGAAFIAIRFFVSFIYVIFASLLSKRYASTRVAGKLSQEKPTHPLVQRDSIPSVIWKSLLKTRNVLSGIVIFLIPIYWGVYYLNVSGIFERLNRSLPESLGAVFPSDSLPIIAAQFNHVLSASSIAATMVGAGEISGIMALVSLLIGSILVAPVRILKHSLPGYLGVYSPLLGTKILLLNTTAKALITLIIIVIIYLLFL